MTREARRIVKRSAMPTYAHTMRKTPVIQSTTAFRRSTRGSARIMKDAVREGTTKSNCTKKAATHASAATISVAAGTCSATLRATSRPTSSGVATIRRVGRGRRASICAELASDFEKMIVVALIRSPLRFSFGQVVARPGAGEQLLLHDRHEFVVGLQLALDLARELRLLAPDVRRAL